MKILGVAGKVGLLMCLHMQLADHNGDFNGAKLVHVGSENHLGVKYLKPSSRSCAAACVLNVGCISFSYNLHTRICLLGNTIIGNTDMVYTKCKCHDDKCSHELGLRCQIFQRYHPYVSEIHFEDKRPDVMDARSQVSNGDTTYTCGNPDFRPCLKKAVGLCQCTGTWTMCGRFKWRSPETYYPLFLPCGSWEEFTATIRGTPSNDSRFEVYVKNGQDAVFYVDFHFNFGDEKFSILCNTRINNEWGRDDMGGPNTLRIGETGEFKIVLRDGIYRLHLDGDRRCTIEESRRGAHPQFIVIENDLNVHSVEIDV